LRAAMMLPLEMMGSPPLKDDVLAGMPFLKTEKGLSRLREHRQIRGSFVEHSRCYRLIDGEIDAADERAVKPRCVRFPPIVLRQLQLCCHSFQATNRFLIFTGSSRTRTPVAWWTASVMAAANPASPISPIPRAPTSLISLSG